MITWEEIIELVPELKQAAQRARESMPCSETGRCQDTVWYDEFKPIVCGFVGWEVKDKQMNHPELYDHEAYDVAYRGLYNCLPECCEPCIRTLPDNEEVE
jgi:hypothetical protein